MLLWQTRIMSFLSIKQKNQKKNPPKLQYILQLYFCVLDHLTWQARKEYTQQQLLKTNLHLRVKKVGLEHQTIWAFITRLWLWGTKKTNWMKWWWEEDCLEDGNIVVDLGAVPLGNALGDPDDVPALLLLQLDVGVENTEVELVEEGQLIQLHLQTRRRWKDKVSTDVKE